MVPTASDMIENIAKQLPADAPGNGDSYVMGRIYNNGHFKLKHAGEMRTMMSHEHSLKGRFFTCLGAALFPTTLQVGLNTLTEPNPYGYV